MRESSFDTVPALSAIPSSGLGGRADLRDRIGAWLVAIAAFLCYYQNGSATSGSSVESSWMQTISHAFASGWQWGTDIVYTYGPLGFLTPYMTWNPEVGASFRVGQLLLCALWAVMVFGFARRLGAIRQGLLILAFVAWYPLLLMDIGWNIPFIFAVVLIHRWSSTAEMGRPRKGILLATVVLLSLLALVKFTGQLMWIGIVGYGVLMAWARRDARLAVAFGVGAPLTLALLWLAAGQNLGGFPGYLATSLQMSGGYGAMSVTPAPRIDELGLFGVALLALAIITLWQRSDRLPSLLASTALAVLAFLAWKVGYVRADDHVAIFFGSASFIAFAALCMPATAGRKVRALRWAAASIIFALGLWVSFGLLHFHWQAPRPAVTLQELLDPQDNARTNQLQWNAQASSLDLPRTRQRIAGSSVDVLMNEQAVAILNRLNFRPRPAFQGYGAYTTELTRINETFLLDATTAPEYLLVKLQSIDSRLPTGEDPLSVLAALRGYLPIDREGGFLVMRRTGGPVAPIQAPEAGQWKAATLGVDLALPTGAEPQALFFDYRLNVWGKLRSALLREPAIRVELELDDGSKQTYPLVRRLGDAGTLISPFLLSSDDYLQWHAGLAERTVKTMRLVAEPSEIALFEPEFSYALAPIRLPRSRVDHLPEELQQVLYPGFHPAPMKIDSGHRKIVEESGKPVLFTHAPSALTFSLGPGIWNATGAFGLLGSAYPCESSDGFALVVDRVDALGTSTRLYSRQVNPVHNTAERGALPFSFGPFPVAEGDQIILRNEVGLAKDATGDCDWVFFGPMDFRKIDDPANAQ